MGTGHDLGTWPSGLDGASASGTGAVRTGTGTVPETVGAGSGVAALGAILQNKKNEMSTSLTIDLHCFFCKKGKKRKRSFVYLIIVK